MSRKPNRSTPFPAAIDFGSYGVRVLVGNMHADGSLILEGVGEAKSAGVKEGIVSNIDEAAEILRNVVRETQLMSGMQIENVLINISGEHLRGQNQKESVATSDETVTVADIDNVRRLAATVVSDKTLRVISTLEREFMIDNQGSIRQPLGMHGKRLIGLMHLVIANRNVLANLEKCTALADLGLAGDFVASIFASGEEVLTEDEKKMGVCLVDIGEGTIDAAIFKNGVIQKTQVWKYASHHIHYDIATIHHTSLEDAERLKRKVGVVVSDDGEMVDIHEVGKEKKVSINKANVRDTIFRRLEENFSDIETFILDFEHENEGLKLFAGIVFVGDGALLAGLEETAREHLKTHVRIGYPRYRGKGYESINSPRFTVGMGLLRMASLYKEKSSHDWWRRFKNLFITD